MTTIDEAEEIWDDIEKIRADVTQIKDFLLGNELNGKRGISAVIEDHDKRLIELEKLKITTELYNKLLIFFGTTITGSLLAILIALITRK